MAILVAGVLLAPLAGAALSATAQSPRVREQAQDVGAQWPRAEALAAWGWGPSTISATWLPGPILEVAPCVGDDDAGGLVGVWIEGWFQGEWEVDQGAEVAIPSSVWHARKEGEAVVRVRSVDSSWGPPWRSLIANGQGNVAAV